MDNQNETKETWAIVELMGHVCITGRLTQPGEFGGLWRVDIPNGEEFRTEFFASGAVYRIRLVSEEIARGWMLPETQLLPWNAPIITKEEHEERVRIAVEQANRRALVAPKWDVCPVCEFNNNPGAEECANCGEDMPDK